LIRATPGICPPSNRSPSCRSTPSVGASKSPACRATPGRVACSREDPSLPPALLAARWRKLMAMRIAVSCVVCVGSLLLVVSLRMSLGLGAPLGLHLRRNTEAPRPPRITAIAPPPPNATHSLGTHAAVPSSAAAAIDAFVNPQADLRPERTHASKTPLVPVPVVPKRDKPHAAARGKVRAWTICRVVARAWASVTAFVVLMCVPMCSVTPLTPAIDILQENGGSRRDPLPLGVAQKKGTAVAKVEPPDEHGKSGVFVTCEDGHAINSCSHLLSAERGAKQKPRNGAAKGGGIGPLAKGHALPAKGSGGGVLTKGKGLGLFRHREGRGTPKHKVAEVGAPAGRFGMGMGRRGDG